MGLFDTPTLGPCEVTLWDFQERAVEAVRDEFKKKVRRTLLNIATGCGKTIIAAKIGRMMIEKGMRDQKSNRVLFIAHTTELIEQTAAKFDLLGVEPGIEQAGSFSRMMFEAEAVVASVQTLSKPDRLSSFDPDHFGLVIVDEGHRVLGETYKRILAHFRSARVLVLTATPLRSDEQEIGHVVESVAMRFSVLDAWEEEKRTGQQYLCDIRMIHPDLGLDLKKLKRHKDDFNDADTTERIRPMIEDICNKMREYVGDDKTVAFFPSIHSARMFAAGMDGLGYRADSVWGTDPDRRSKIRQYREGDLKVLSNMNMLVEGWDVPETTNVILARRTESWSMVLQQIGRGLRAGKEFCRVIDVGDITGQFGDTPAGLFVQPLGILGGEGFDEEMNRILAEMMRKNPEISLKAAIEEAKDEFERRKNRQQFAVRLSIAERTIDCEERQYSVRSMHDGEEPGAIGATPAPNVRLKPATEGQLRFLRALGFENVDGLSRGRAGTLISYAKRQRDAGKSHVGQRRRLIKTGVDAADARNMSVGQANDYLSGLEDKRRKVYGG